MPETRAATVLWRPIAIGCGGLTGLVGPNGAGKSTPMKAWVGLERPSTGEVRARGIDPWRNRPRAVVELAYVPQSPALYRGLTVSEHLAQTPPPSGGRHVSSFLGAQREALDLWRLTTDETSSGDSTRAATLEQVVLGYLTASRSAEVGS